jgi:hypothetical protein
MGSIKHGWARVDVEFFVSMERKKDYRAGIPAASVLGCRAQAGENAMTETYKDFLIRSGSEPLSETLLGRTTQWHATGTIFYVRPNRSVVELTRLRLACMRFDDQEVAEWFGLELARLCVDACYGSW